MICGQDLGVQNLKLKRWRYSRDLASQQAMRSTRFEYAVFALALSGWL